MRGECAQRNLGSPLYTRAPAVERVQSEKAVGEGEEEGGLSGDDVGGDVGGGDGWSSVERVRAKSKQRQGRKREQRVCACGSGGERLTHQSIRIPWPQSPTAMVSRGCHRRINVSGVSPTVHRSEEQR